ncbi:16S rRNA (guanine(966)-N(2))-methyltransferase RsmD, partial [Candidatus Margulisiibacteriota bacterium]
NILVEEVGGCRFLDLFAGTGAVGIEALSRGAAVCFFVEMDKKAVAVIRDNLGTTGFSDQSEVYSIDVLKAITLFNRKQAFFDVIYIGAPYNNPILEETLKALSSGSILNATSMIVAEHRKDHELADNYDSLKRCRQSKYGDTVLSFYKR